jgi:copper chaperone NosL
MKAFLAKVDRFLEAPLGLWPRGLLLLAALCVLPAYLSPLWDMTMFAPQYPDGLRLHIWSHRLDGGNGGQDLKEINLLNHYIGMKDLEASDFSEFKWMPFVLGALGLLFLRSAALGRMTHLVDVVVLFLYFGFFSLWSFAYKMWSYGHSLLPTAAVRVDPFMPPLFGHRKLANFEVYSYPALGSYGLFAVAGLLLLALFLAWRDTSTEATEAQRHRDTK